MQSLQIEEIGYFKSLDRNVVSFEKTLMPLSVFIEDHLCVSRFDEDACSGIDFECRID